MKESNLESYQDLFIRTYVYPVQGVETAKPVQKRESRNDTVNSSGGTAKVQPVSRLTTPSGSVAHNEWGNM